MVRTNVETVHRNLENIDQALTQIRQYLLGRAPEPPPSITADANQKLVEPEGQVHQLAATTTWLVDRGRQVEIKAAEMVTEILE